MISELHFDEPEATIIDPADFARRVTVTSKTGKKVAPQKRTVNKGDVPPGMDPKKVEKTRGDYVDIPNKKQDLALRKGSKTVVGKARQRSSDFRSKVDEIAEEMKLVLGKSKVGGTDQDALEYRIMHNLARQPANLVKAAYEKMFPDETKVVEGFPKHANEALWALRRRVTTNINYQKEKALRKSINEPQQPSKLSNPPTDAADIDRSDDAYDIPLASKLAKIKELEQARGIPWIYGTLNHLRTELHNKGYGINAPDPKKLNSLVASNSPLRGDDLIQAAGGTPLSQVHYKLRNGELWGKDLEEALDESKHWEHNHDNVMVNQNQLQKLMPHIGVAPSPAKGNYSGVPLVSMREDPNASPQERGFITPDVINKAMKVTPGADKGQALNRAAADTGVYRFTDQNDPGFKTKANKNSPHQPGRVYTIAGKHWTLKGFQGQHAVFMDPNGNRAKAKVSELDKYRSPVANEKESPSFSLEPMSENEYADFAFKKFKTIDQQHKSIIAEMNNLMKGMTDEETDQFFKDMAKTNQGIKKLNKYGIAGKYLISKGIDPDNYYGEDNYKMLDHKHYDNLPTPPIIKPIKDEPSADFSRGFMSYLKRGIGILRTRSKRMSMSKRKRRK